jgi:hypothetical protein
MWSYSGNGDFCSTSGNDYWRGIAGVFSTGYMQGVFTPCISCCETEAPNNGDSEFYNKELGCEVNGVTAFPKCSPGYEPGPNTG